MEQMADAIATGGCPSWEEYKRMVGKIEGYAEAERIVLDLKAAQEAAEEEDV